MHNLTGIYWIKNEASYLPEYLEFHLLQGFDHFIFYDNGSTDNLLEVVKPYGTCVEIRSYPQNLQQAKNFWLAKEGCYEQRGKSRWIHFHAIDERIFCPDGRSIPEFLVEYQKHPGVAVAWDEFNSNGHLTRPEGLVIENYTQTCRDIHCHIKTIVQPNFVEGFAGNPHCFVYNKGHAVTENYTPVFGPFSPGDYSYTKIKNHHYRTMSKEEFEVKMGKGSLDHRLEDVRREQADDEWAYAHGSPSRWGQTTLGECRDLFPYITAVKQNLARRLL